MGITRTAIVALVLCLAGCEVGVEDCVPENAGEHVLEPALLDGSGAAAVARKYLAENHLDWGEPVRIEPIASAVFRLFYETPAPEEQRLGPRVLGVDRSKKIVWQYARR